MADVSNVDSENIKDLYDQLEGLSCMCTYLLLFPQNKRQ